MEEYPQNKESPKCESTNRDVVGGNGWEAASMKILDDLRAICGNHQTESFRVARTEISNPLRRWAGLRHKAKQAGLGSYRIAGLANKAEMNWYRTREDETLEGFLRLEGPELVATSGFGRIKIKLLCDIVERTLQRNELAVVETAKGHVDLPAILEDWNVPLDFPCALLVLPIRVRNHFPTGTLGELLEVWERFGFNGFLALPKIGRKSVEEVARFMESLELRDRVAASAFLPLSAEGDEGGLSLARGLVFAGEAMKPSDFALLRPRLIAGLTLEDSAVDQGVTRERVRQVEGLFLDGLRRYLGYFEREREVIFSELMSTGELEGKWLAPVSGELRELVRHGLLAIFEESPQGVARCLELEVTMEAVFEKLGRHEDFWFGGVALEPFLDTELPVKTRAAFLSALMENENLRLDHRVGRVHPARTNFKSVVRGLLLAEDAPVPLTWLIGLIQATGYHPEANRYELARRRQAWEKSEDFPSEMIIWEE